MLLISHHPLFARYFHEILSLKFISMPLAQLKVTAVRRDASTPDAPPICEYTYRLGIMPLWIRLDNHFQLLIRGHAAGLQDLHCS